MESLATVGDRRWVRWPESQWRAWHALREYLAVTEQSLGLTDEVVAAKWAEVGPLIDAVTARIQDPGEFVVQPSSELAVDDAATSPYHVSHCARWCLNAGVDHLHALKSLVIDGSLIHSAASYSLARGALENFGAGFWLLHPPERHVRVERALRWWAKNFKDQNKATALQGPPHHTPVGPKLDRLVAIGAAANCDVTGIRGGYTSTAVLQYADEHSSIKPFLVWQLCSGFAHGRPWASLGMNERQSQPSGEDGVSMVMLTADHARLLAVTLPAVHLLTDFLRLHEERSRASS